jgi:signal transduction histidine kinase
MSQLANPPTTMATVTTPTITRTADVSPRPRRQFPVDRLRIVGWFVVLLAGAAVVTVLAVRQILLSRLDERVEEALRQEIEEVRALATGNDPDSGQPFGDDVEAIFDTFLTRNVPHEGEALFTVVDGRSYKTSVGAPYRLDDDAELVSRWANLTDTVRGETDTPAGAARWMATPLSAEGRTLGVFVVANFLDLERDEVDDAVRVVVLVSIAVVALGSIAAWAAAGRVLAPVRHLTQTARSISAEGGLERRIEVGRAGELSRLAATFNEMLDRLQAAFRSQAAFINDASHELRTPLTIVRGHLQLLDDDPAERETTLRLVMDELNRMGRLVDDLVLLARAEQPGFLHVGPVDLDTFTVEVHAKAEAIARRDWRIDEVVDVTIDADRDRLTQAMINLAANAANHTDEGAEIGIGSAIRDGEAYLWVRDTGSGIAAGDETRIFARFARGADVTRSSRGAGLGLAITRAIVDAHGGRIKLDNHPGSGATFALILPLKGPVR